MTGTPAAALHPLPPGIFDAAALTLPAAVRLACGDRIFGQPLVVSGEEIAVFARDVQVVFDAIVDLPRRLFDGDWSRFARAVDVGEEAARFMADSVGLPLPRYGRADMHHDGSGFRLLELNIGSEIGGLERAGLLPAAFHRQIPAGHPQRTSLTSIPTHRRVAAALATAARATAGTGHPVVGLVDAPDSRRQFEAYWQALAEVMTDEGLPTVVGDLDTVDVTRDTVTVQGRRVDLVLRYASVEEILRHRGGASTVRRLIGSARHGHVTLWTPPHSNAFGSKVCLALLSDGRNAAFLTGTERAAVRRLVPWTRALNPRLEGRSPQEHARLVRHTLDHRQDLVLKPSTGHGGVGVVMGSEASPQEWAHLVTRAAAGDQAAVVQRVVPPRTETFPPGLGVTDVKAAYGAFITPAGLAGSYARVVPTRHGGVVGMSSSPETKTAAVLMDLAGVSDRKG